MTLKLLAVIPLASLMLMATSIQALTIPAVPTEPIYFEPPVVDATDEQQQLSCVALDNTIRYLHPYRYSYKPQFEQDGSNKMAVALVTIDNFPIMEGLFGLAYLGYSSMVEEKEQRRMLQVEQQITMLQQLKAEKHCFE